MQKYSSKLFSLFIISVLLIAFIAFSYSSSVYAFADEGEGMDGLDLGIGQGQLIMPDFPGADEYTQNMLDALPNMIDGNNSIEVFEDTKNILGNFVEYLQNGTPEQILDAENSGLVPPELLESIQNNTTEITDSILNGLSQDENYMANLETFLQQQGIINEGFDIGAFFTGIWNSILDGLQSFLEFLHIG